MAIAAANGAVSMAANTTVHALSPIQTQPLPMLAMIGRSAASPNSMLATAYMPSGKTMLQSGGW